MVDITMKNIFNIKIFILFGNSLPNQLLIIPIWLASVLTSNFIWTEDSRVSCSSRNQGSLEKYFVNLISWSKREISIDLIWNVIFHIWDSCPIDETIIPILQTVSILISEYPFKWNKQTKNVNNFVVFFYMRIISLAKFQLIRNVSSNSLSFKIEHKNVNMRSLLLRYT